MIKSDSCPLCPLCAIDRAGPGDEVNGPPLLYFQDQRDYWQCQCCALVFVAPAQRLGAGEEKAEYDLHQNSPLDQGYRNFLSRLMEPLLAHLGNDAEGLDFGCGPGPTLSLMLQEKGYPVAVFDPFYANERELLECRYDFITATEVVEHLFAPGEVLQQLWQILRRGGSLGIMTKMVQDAEAFARWHYKNDPTHVCFFSRKTFAYLAEKFDAELQIVGQDVILLHKA